MFLGWGWGWRHGRSGRTGPPKCSGCPPSAHGDSPHRAMKIAKSTVPSLSKRCVSWGEGRTRLGAALRCPPRPQRGSVSPTLQGQTLSFPSSGKTGWSGAPGAANLGKGAGVRELLVPTAVVAARAQEDVVGLTDLLAVGARTGQVAAPPDGPIRARPPLRPRPSIPT